MKSFSIQKKKNMSSSIFFEKNKFDARHDHDNENDILEIKLDTKPRRKSQSIVTKGFLNNQIKYNEENSTENKKAEEGETLHCHIEEFIQITAPKDQTIKCKVYIERGLFDEYFFFLEEYEPPKLLMRSMRKKSSLNTFYHIQVADNFYANPSKFGRLYSDLNKTNYTLVGDKLNEKLFFNLEYEKYTKLIGADKPKRFNLEIVQHQTTDNQAGDKMDKLFQRASATRYTKLITKKPYYDPASRHFKLDFKKRVRLPSLNNIQIVDEADQDTILFQCGKYESKCYNIDFTYPFCAFTAFGLAIACLNRN